MSTRMLLGLLVALAGCVEYERMSNEPDRSFEGDAFDPAPGTMTARERSAESVRPCGPNGLTLPPRPPVYCATRHLWIDGSLELERLPALLATINGAITLEPAPAGTWNLTIVVRGAARASHAEAREALDEVSVTWSHETPGGHRLEAEVRITDDQCNECPRADVALRLPASLVTAARLQTTNGDIQADGRAYAALSARTTNGEVRVQPGAVARDMSLETTNGGIQAHVRASVSGTWSASTTNGGIRFTMPEDARRGYDLSARTTNGDVDVALRDGSLSGDEEDRRFVTHGFSARSIQTQVRLGTTNGDVDVTAG